MTPGPTRKKERGSKRGKKREEWEILYENIWGTGEFVWRERKGTDEIKESQCIVLRMHAMPVLLSTKFPTERKSTKSFVLIDLARWSTYDYVLFYSPTPVFVSVLMTTSIIAMIALANFATDFGPASDCAYAADVAHYVVVGGVVEVDFFAAAGEGGGRGCDAVGGIVVRGVEMPLW